MILTMILNRIVRIFRSLLILFFPFGLSQLHYLFIFFVVVIFFFFFSGICSCI